MTSRLLSPATDPTPIFDWFRGNLGTELLVAAAAHFDLFGRLARAELLPQELGIQLGLAERPQTVLFTALRAMGLLTTRPSGALALTDLARAHLVPGAPHDVSGYLGLAAESPGVLEMIQRLRSNRPAAAGKDEPGAAFIFRPDLDSAMEQQQAARRLTLALAGRAKNVAPALAEAVPLDDARCLLDVGGGTGLYSIAWLQRHPGLRAIVWDRPHVLAVAREMAADYGVAERLECQAGEMFSDPVPAADVCLLSNILHDWDTPDCRKLVARCAAKLPPGGLLIVHDVLLNDALDGPLEVALYSAALFSVTEGRAYSRAEYTAWLAAAGLVLEAVRPTRVHCFALVARKPR
ncbi:MAG TPA: methyltransferase [Pirellulales bacterium]|jgi:predicted O-methyltransferase YrrM|nr:methyltransferase [Pirellulales bacterium]